MPINFIHNQIQTKAAVVREKLPLSIKVLVAAAVITLAIVASLAVYRLFFSSQPATSSQQEPAPSNSEPAEPALFLLPPEVRDSYEINPHCPLQTTTCPDGTVISRTGENCSFPPCP